MQNSRIIFITLLMLVCSIAQAETIYVIDELKIGLHEQPTVDSPIQKLVNSGSTLTVIERKDGLVNVEDSDGARGWINDKYVVTAKPAKTRVTELEKEIELLKSLAESSAADGDGTEVQSQIAQLLKSERLKSGELQAKLADLKAKIASADDSEHLLTAIEELKLENGQLISQLESSGIDFQSASSSPNASEKDWKKCLMIFLAVFIVGMVAGAFILDYVGRRKHGGFRI